MRKVEINLTINGSAVAIAAEPRWTLADVLRDICGLTGTHLGCEHGVCGACTIILDGEPIRSCLMFAVQADGRNVQTVEGLAQNGELHPLQKAFMKNHALQCGFCTPGFLMLAAALLQRDPPVEQSELRDALASNLCRCTGYENIAKAVYEVVTEMGSD